MSASWIDRLLASPTRDGLALSARFAEARHAVLAENVANLDTPDYQTKVLDPRQFQQALREAFKRSEAEGQRVLELRGRQVSTDETGRLRTRPALQQAENALFHDGTNTRLENLMVAAQENQLAYNFAMTRLKSSFDRMLTAIRGRA